MKTRSSRGGGTRPWRKSKERDTTTRDVRDCRRIRKISDFLLHMPNQKLNGKLIHQEFRVRILGDVG